MSQRIVYIPNRVINTDGIADGASLYVYQSRTTTPVSLYSDKNLTVPVTNPYVVPAGAAVPTLYSNFKNIRLKVVSTNGDIDDTDPYNPLALGDYLNNFVTPKDYGAIGDNTTDDVTALNNFWTDVITNDLPHDCSGNYAISARVTIGPSIVPSVVSNNPLIGRMKLTALAPMNEMVRLRNLAYRDCSNLELNMFGLGDSTFASRTCLIGAYLENCSRAKLGRIQGKRFALANAYFGTANNNAMEIGHIVGTFIGSGRSGESLTANWSLPINAGASGSTTQNTQITVDALPSTAIQSYETSGTGQIQVRIAGYLYLVSSIVGSNVTIYPWLDNTSFATGTGTLEWVLGGNMCTRGTDANRIKVEVLDSADCSRGLSEGVLYGSIIDDMLNSIVGTEIALGRSLTGSCSGTQISRYTEGGGAASHEQIVTICGFAASTDALFLGTSGAPDLSKCWNLSAPRATAGQILGGEFGNTTAGAGTITMSVGGKLLLFNKTNLNNLPGATINLRGQSHSSRTTVYLKDTVTFLLNVEGSGEYNRLFGYSGGSTLVVGTGTNGAPSGNIVFTPPAGGTINGGAVNATVTFSGFYGPTLFTYEHTDTAQLTWVVRPVSGWLAGLISQPITPTTVTIGGGTAITKIVVYTPTLTPASVAAATVAEQTFTVTGVTTADTVEINPPAIGNSTGIAGVRVSAADTIAIRFVNPTAGPLTPTSGVYRIIGHRS